MKVLAGRNAFVTGAASGIGLGIAEALARRGVNVALADIERPRLLDAVTRIEAHGVRALPVVVDVADRTAMRAAAGEVEAALGPVHILCNNAGVATGGRLQDARDEDWDWLLAVNLGGVINGLQAFLPRMLAHGEEGHVVNTASVAGLYPMPAIGIYNASKYAVTGLTETLRDDLAGTPLGVSLLCPGYVRTAIGDSRRNRQERFGAWKPPVSGLDTLTAAAGEIERGLDPGRVGEMVVAAILRDRFYILTDPGFWQDIRRRFERMARDVFATRPQESEEQP